MSVGSFVKGVPAGTCVAFTLDKAERTNYSPKADDVETITVPHIPTNNICGQKKTVPGFGTVFLCPHVLAIKGIYSGTMVIRRRCPHLALAPFVFPLLFANVLSL